MTLWRATMEFLADWFSRPNDENGRVAGYVIGNEVNVHWQWHNLGRMPRNAIVADTPGVTRGSLTCLNSVVRRAASGIGACAPGSVRIQRRAVQPSPL